MEEHIIKPSKAKMKSFKNHYNCGRIIKLGFLADVEVSQAKLGLTAIVTEALLEEESKALLNTSLCQTI